MSFQPPRHLSPLLIILWAVSLALVLMEGSKIKKSASAIRDSISLYSSDSETALRLNGMTKEELQLFSKDAKQLDFQNPIYYANSIYNSEKIPSDFHEIVAQIDPDNGWFQIWEVAKLADGVIKSKPRSRSDRSINPLEPRPPNTYEILDSEKLEALVGLLQKAADAPRLDPYFGAISAERSQALPEPHDFLSNMINLSLIAGVDTPVLQWKKCSDIITAALGQTDSETEFQRLEAITMTLEKRSLNSIHTLVDGLVRRAIISRNANVLRANAERLGLSERAQYYRARWVKVAEYTEEVRNRDGHEFEKLMSQRADMFTALSSPAMYRTVSGSLPLTREMLYPGLRAERALASRVIFTFVFLFLSLSALVVWLKGRGKNNPTTFLPELKFLGLAVLLPFVSLVVFRYFFSFGMLDFSARLLFFTNYYLPDISSLLVLLTVPYCLLRKRQFPEQKSWKTWWPAGVSVLALLTSAAIPQMLMGPAIFQRGFLLPILLILILLGWLILRPFLKKKSEFDFTGRLTPAYLLAAALVGFSVIGLVSEERYWFAKNELGKVNATHFTEIERQIVEVLKKEICELAEYD